MHGVRQLRRKCCETVLHAGIRGVGLTLEVDVDAIEVLVRDRVDRVLDREVPVGRHCEDVVEGRLARALDGEEHTHAVGVRSVDHVDQVLAAVAEIAAA